MQRPLFSARNEPTLEDERGAVIVFTVIILVALMLVGGLAIDAGNLYRARLALQNAADAASLAGVQHVVDIGLNSLKSKALAKAGATEADVAGGSVSLPAVVEDYLNEHMQEVAYANLELAGFPHDPDNDREVTFVGSYSPTAPPEFGEARPQSVFDYQVTLTRTIDFFIIDLIPGSNFNSSTLSVTAEARRRIANIVLIVDVSRSMGCPGIGDCDCLLAGGDCGEDTKYEILLDAITSFLQRFDLRFDEVVVAPFNMAAAGISINKLLEPNGLFTELGFTPENFSSIGVDNLIAYLQAHFPPEGATNICDGLFVGRSLMAVRAPGQAANFVLFSDGAPTAGRFLFSDVKGLNNWTNPTGDGGTHDYSHYELDWKTPDDILPGPSVLYQTGLVEVGDDFVAPPAPVAGEAALANCGPATAPAVNTAADIVTAADAVFGSCLNSLESHVPGAVNKTFGRNYGRTVSGHPTKTFADWREQYYNCPIAVSDHIRANKGIFYVIGLGDDNPDPDAVDPADPYSNVNDSFFRKDQFLSRIALDAMKLGTFPEDYDFQGYQDVETAMNAQPEAAGLYLPTDNPDELKLLFEKIARKILLKLIE